MVALKIEEILLSIIIKVGSSGEILLSEILGAITTIEAAFDLDCHLNYKINYEIIVLIPAEIASENQDILGYLKSQGYSVVEFVKSCNLLEVFNQGIEQSQGRYILQLIDYNQVCVNAIYRGIEHLEQCFEIGAVYLGSTESQANTEIRDFSTLDFTKILRQGYQAVNLIFRKSLWSRYYQAEFFSQKNDHSIVKVLEVREIPWVSVCIPTYNGELLIQEALSSVMTQTYPRIELLISDDESTDKTLEIVQSFLEKSAVKFSIFPHQHYGLAENCNFVASQSQGQYIKFLFQDDLLMPTCIEEMVFLAEQDREIGLVFSDRDIFFSTGAETNPDLNIIYQDFRNICRAWTNLKTVQSGQELLADPNLLRHPINKIGEPSTVLLRRSVLEQVGGFDPGLNQLVDLDLWLRILNCAKVGFIDKTLSCFRLHLQQKTYQNICENVAIDLNFYYKVCHHPSYSFLLEELRYHALWIYTVNLIRCDHYDLNFQSDSTPLECLRQVRFWVAQEWLRCPNDGLQNVYSCHFGKVHRILSRNKKLKAQSLTRAEEVFVDSLVNNLLQSLDQFESASNWVQTLFSLALYQGREQLQMLTSTRSIPQRGFTEVEYWVNANAPLAEGLKSL
ncbi:MAG: glycosyltransferase family 2 protein [Microcoleaceae cyanobacterium]